MLPQQERCLTLLVLAAAGCYATKPSQVKHLKSLDETEYNTNGSMLHGILEGAQKYKNDHQDDSVEPIFKKFESWSHSAVLALKSAGDPKLERLGEDGLDIFRQFHQLYNDLNATMKTSTKLKQLNNTQEVDKSKADLQHVADSLKKMLHVNDTDYTPKIEKSTKKTSEKINVTEEKKKIEIVKRWFLDVMHKFFIGTPNGTDFKNMLRRLLAIATKDLRSLYIAVLVYGNKVNEMFEKTFVARNKEKKKGGRSFGNPPWQQPQNPRQNYQPSKSNVPPFNWNMGSFGMDGSPLNGRGGDNMGDNWMDNMGGDISMGGMGEGFPMSGDISMGGMDAGSIGNIGFNMGMEDPPDPVPPPPPPPKEGEGEDDNPLDKYDFGDSPKDEKKKGAKGDANPIQNTPLPPCDASIPAHKKYLDGLANQNQSPANFRPTYTGPQQRPDRVLKIIENQKSSLGQYQPNQGQRQPNYGPNGLPFTANASVPRYYRQALPNQTQPIYQVPIRRRKSGSRFTETSW